MEEIKINVKAMGEYQTNCYVVSIGDSDLIIDPGVNALPWIKEQVKNPVAILNTHAHFDHVWSNDEVQKHYNIPIYCPKDDIFMLSDDIFGIGVPFSVADYEMEHDETINLLDKEIKFHFFPGHTPGCSAISIDNHLFTGDFIFAGSLGRTDFPFSNPEDMKESLRKVLKWEKNYNIYSGHGAFTNLHKEKDSLKAWLNYL